MRTADMVHVAVGVDERVHRVRGPAPERRNDRPSEGLQARIEQHQTLAAVDRDHVRERLDERDTRADLGQLEGEAAARLVGALVDDPGRQCQQIGHAGRA